MTFADKIVKENAEVIAVCEVFALSNMWILTVQLAMGIVTEKALVWLGKPKKQWVSANFTKGSTKAAR